MPRFKISPQNHKISSWIYQLQNADFYELLEIDVDLLVIDPDDAGFTENQLNTLRESGKLILAYLSIGEAEDYRNYWKKEWYENPPEWLGEENPDWPGCYKVKYWYSEWQAIVYSRLNETILNGYDGAYLDCIDAYEYWTEKGIDEAKELMIEFVISISEKAKSLKPGFLIFPQNCPELVADSRYSNAIDGLGKEDTWYIGDEPRSQEDIEYDIYYLDLAVRKGKTVLVIDYVTELDKIIDFFNKARERGYIPYVGPRELDKIGYYTPPSNST